MADQQPAPTIAEDGVPMCSQKCPALITYDDGQRSCRLGVAPFAYPGHDVCRPAVRLLVQRCADAETDASASRFLANHHREESVQLKQRCEELTAECARLEVEKAEALEMLGQAQGTALDLEIENDALRGGAESDA